MPDLFALNLALSASHGWNDALQILQEVLKHSLEPSPQTLSPLMSACSQDRPELEGIFFFLGEVPNGKEGMLIGMITRIVKWIVFIMNHLQATVWRRAVAFGSIENEVLLNCMTTAYQKGDQWVQVH